MDRPLSALFFVFVFLNEMVMLHDQLIAQLLGVVQLGDSILKPCGAGWIACMHWVHFMLLIYEIINEFSN